MPIHNQFSLDPNGQMSAAELRRKGPRIPVQISIPVPLAQKLTSQGLPIPAPQTGEALIDTGASITCVDLQTIQALSLQPVNQTTITTPSQINATASVYAVSIDFPQLPIQRVARNLRVAGVTLLPQGFIALLGRDFLAGVVLTYNGVGGFFTIAH
jgi:predicted aspartyl protease